MSSIGPNATFELTGTNALALITARIEMLSGRTKLGTATGFFFHRPEQKATFFVTNRHVLVDEQKQFFPDSISARLHTDANDLRQSSDLLIPLYDSVTGKPLWRELSPDTDVVAIAMRTEQTQPYVIRAFQPSDIIAGDVVLGLGDPLVIIGYPVGFYDDVHNLPVFRQGTVASVFPVPFKGKHFFLVDAKLHPGTSGSPVITKPSVMYQRGKSVVLAGGPGFFLLGVNSGAYGDLELNSVWYPDTLKKLTN